MVEKQSKSTRSVAVGGIFLALSIATLYAATFIPGIELTLYTISSFYVAFILIETGPGGGLLFYTASLLLSALLIPNKIGLIPYAMFFGLYGIVKYYIEYSKKLPMAAEILLKLLFFNISIGIGLVFFKELFLGAFQVPDLAFPILAAGAQIFFLFYDYLFTLAIGFYLKTRPRA
ncbi:hypothetical protein [Sinanaerobacter chloroacetimidivorans]|uniref:Uncharacterized protein n=1 Tax=Sinanaerobacter chloroacetimidivorans TaxID=2818044 RepID=A0A8J7VZS4_9FIRM|nr:hypothetical protein [Sinanaerobacter chloroacetimidivorans]MBR0596375.1 hypothetical protein [Sinanaerobacter chloroacetimidivorans]